MREKGKYREEEEERERERERKPRKRLREKLSEKTQRGLVPPSSLVSHSVEDEFPLRWFDIST